jgi:hypothetical protein
MSPVAVIRRGVRVAAVLLICAGLLGCADGALPHSERQGPERRSVPWWPMSMEAPDTLRIISHVEYCVGEPEPTIARVDISYSAHAVVITVEAKIAGPKQSEREVACLGAARPLYRNIKLSQPLEGRAVLDGSFDPPKRRLGKREGDGNQSVRWQVVYPPSPGKEVTIGSVNRWCVGTPKPRMTRVDVSEGRQSVVLTAFVTRPRLRGKNLACAGLELGLGKTVRLSRGLGDRALFDGSTSPLEKRWPR